MDVDFTISAEERAYLADITPGLLDERWGERPDTELPEQPDEAAE